MSAEEIQGLVSFIGIVVQLLGAVLLVALFYMLQRYARRRVYFSIWGWSWAALSVAMGALAVRYNMAPSFDPLSLMETTPAVRGLYLVYQLGKLLFCGLLVVGTTLYATGLGFKRRVVYGVVVLISAAYALVSVAASPDLGRILVWQGPVVAVALAYCSLTLLQLPPSRSSFGSKRTGVVFGILGALWALYFVGFALPPGKSPGPAHLALDLLLNYNSYIDLLVQMFLGYGMVVMLMEDAKHEVDDARVRLEVAHDQLKRESLYDALTGALNRRAFASGVGLEMAKATFGSVVMLDMNNLKEVNDRHGHSAGDVLLRNLAAALRATLRASDGLYRWGGDEFLLVLPGAMPAEVRRRVEAGIASTADMSVAGSAEGVRLDVSVGAAGYSGAEGLEEAIQRADAEMYREKKLRKLGREAAQAPAQVLTVRG